MNDILSINQIKKIYKGAVIHKGAVIREGAVICTGAVICDGAEIHKGAVVREGAVIYDGAVIHKGAVIREGAVIYKGFEGIVLHGGYKYSASCYYDSRTNQIIIRLGCYHRTLKEWEQDFDNNPNEFPIDSLDRQKRWNVYCFLKSWALKYFKDLD